MRADRGGDGGAVLVVAVKVHGAHAHQNGTGGKAIGRRLGESPCRGGKQSQRQNCFLHDFCSFCFDIHEIAFTLRSAPTSLAGWLQPAHSVTVQGRMEQNPPHRRAGNCK